MLWPNLCFVQTTHMQANPALVAFADAHPDADCGMLVALFTGAGEAAKDVAEV